MERKVRRADDGNKMELLLRRTARYPPWQIRNIIVCEEEAKKKLTYAEKKIHFLKHMKLHWEREIVYMDGSK